MSLGKKVVQSIGTYSRKISGMYFHTYFVKTLILPKKPNNFPINDA